METIETREAKTVLEKTVISCEEYICKLADDNFEGIDDKLNFVMSCAINLFGNLTIKCSNHEVENAKLNGTIAMQELSRWFSEVIPNLEKLHEKKAS